jgi:hypothetical protein
MKRKFLFLILYFSLFTFHFSIAQSWIWAKNGQGYAATSNVASDTKGNACISGSFSGGEVTFSSDTLMNSKMDYDIFLVKYDSKGNLLWAKSPIDRDSSDNEAFSVSTDKFDNVLITGDFTDTLNFGSLLLAPSVYNNYDAFIAKYDSAGNIIWAKSSRHKPLSGVMAYSVATDEVGNSYITGYASDTVWFGTFKLNRGVFLVKYDSIGNVVWAKCSNGDSGVSSWSAVTTDIFGNVYVTGDSYGSIIFGSDTVTIGGVDQSFLAKYDSSGNVKWAVGSQGTSTASSRSVVTDATGNIYITGPYQQGGITFGGETLQTVGNSDFAFLVKYDSTGNVIWAKNSYVPGGNTGSIGCSVVTDKANNLYLSVTSDTIVSFGLDTLYPPQGWTYPCFIVEFDSSGRIICSTSLGNGSNNWFNSIAIEPTTQEIFISGHIVNQSPFIIGNDTLRSSDKTSYPYIAKWLPCFDSLWDAGIKPSTNISPNAMIYPNPNNGIFTIALQNVNEPAKVEVYNVLGEEIYQTKLNFSDTQINLGSQPGGVYFYRVITENGGLIGSGKLIVE